MQDLLTWQYDGSERDGLKRAQESLGGGSLSRTMGITLVKTGKNSLLLM